MYTITNESFGDSHIIKLTNTDTGEYFSIIPKRGAKVHEIVLKKNDQLVSILDNEKDPTLIAHDNWHKGEFLIPFPNRINNGEYEFKGKKYSLDINMPEENNAIHGFMFSQHFTMLPMTNENSGSIAFEYVYDGNIAGYPFPCTVQYTFSLTLHVFSCDISVVNKGDETIPLGVGWHPYFSLGTEVNNLELKMPSSRKIEVNERMIPTGEKTLFTEYGDFLQLNDTHFDTGFEVISTDDTVTTAIRNPDTDIVIELQQTGMNNGFKYVQVFTPPGRKTIALEPMTCPADAFNSKESLIELPPGEKWAGSFRVTLG